MIIYNCNSNTKEIYIYIIAKRSFAILFDSGTVDLRAYLDNWLFKTLPMRPKLFFQFIANRYQIESKLKVWFWIEPSFMTGRSLKLELIFPSLLWQKEHIQYNSNPIDSVNLIDNHFFPISNEILNKRTESYSYFLIISAFIEGF